MKHYFEKYYKKYLDKFTKKKNRRNITRKVTLHETKRDNYKCKRKQLSIHFKKFDRVKEILKYKTLIFSLLSIVLLLWILFLIFGPVYTVKYINIIRQDNNTDMNLAYSAVDDLRWKGMFEIEDKVIEEKLKNYQNNIGYVDVDLNFPNTLDIYIASYPVYFQTQIEKISWDPESIRNYYITQNGTLIPWKKSDEVPIIELKNGLETNALPDFKKFFLQEDIEAMYHAIDFFEKNIVGTKIQTIYYYQIEKEVHFILENNNRMIYTLSKKDDEGTIKNQITKTAIFHAEQKKITDEDIIYIDMRISNKIFYCTTETQRTCEANLKKIYPE